MLIFSLFLSHDDYFLVFFKTLSV